MVPEVPMMATVFSTRIPARLQNTGLVDWGERKPFAGAILGH